MSYQMRLEDISWNAVESVKDSFNRLPHTTHLDGNYRLRRYSRIRRGDQPEFDQSFDYIKLGQKPFNQSEDYNKHQGGMSRLFEDIEDGVVISLGMRVMCEKFLEAGGFADDHVIEVHQMRIVTNGEETSVSPEGVHQDGYDFIAIVGVERYNISGGQALVYKTREGKPIFECPLQPGEMLMVNDKKLWHNAVGITRLHPDMPGYMDAFILTARN